MRVFAIGDLHLAGGTGKTMDRFGEHWHDHDQKIFDAWKRIVCDDDLVLVAGDTSWAMRLERSSARPRTDRANAGAQAAGQRQSRLLVGITIEDEPGAAPIDQDPSGQLDHRQSDRSGGHARVGLSQRLTLSKSRTRKSTNARSGACARRLTRFAAARASSML